MAKWTRTKDASNWWYLAGLIGTIGNIVAIIYVLISESKMRVYSLLYIIGIIGPLIVYFVARDDDHKIADLSKKLFIGNILVLVILAAIFLLIFIFAFPLLHSFSHNMIVSRCINYTNGTKVCS